MKDSVRIQTRKDLHCPAIFLSDIHLGTRGCRADSLLAFLNTYSCDTLYLVGDIVDGWRLKSSFYWPQSHTEVVQKLMEKSRAGTRIVYVVGNHDEFLRKYTDLQLGNVELRDEAVHTTVSGKQLLVTHGDQFDIVTRYHRQLAILGDISYSVLLRLNVWLNLLRERSGYHYWSLSAWVKRKVKSAVSYIGRYEDAVVHECKRRGFDGIVCGHIHHAEACILQGTLYYNCGDWVESCTALLEDESGEISVHEWQQPSAEIVALKPQVSVGG